MVVEDNPEVRTLMRDTLAGLGYLVLEAPGGPEALQVVEGHQKPIDLLVTDLVMPGFGGWELAKRLAQIHPEMRVLYVSGYADHETASRALGEPKVAYLQKPFALAEFARKVEAIIAQSKKPERE